MLRYIDAGALYERTAEWEARALAYIEKLNKTPYAEMSAEERVEWVRWTAILGERSAFKHDVSDAPTADVRENVHAHWVVLEDEIGLYGCSNCEHKILRKMTNFCPNCGARMDERSDDD